MAASSVSSAPGKIVLLGEYAVLQGAQAVVAASSVRVRVGVTTRDLLGAAEHDDARHLFVMALQIHDEMVVIRAGEAAADSRFELVRHCFDEVLKWAEARQLSLAAVEVKIDSSEFFLPSGEKLGLGGSAAVSVALIGALLRELSPSQNPEPQLLRSLATAAHRKAQGGAGSGIDIAAGVYGGFLNFRREQNPQPLTWPDELKILPLSTPHSSNTADLVAAVMAKSKQADVHKTLAAMANLAQAGNTALANDDAQAWLDVVRKYHNCYGELGAAAKVTLITPEHAQLAAIAESVGAAYKPSGAGGGDIGVAFCAGDEVLAQLRGAIASAAPWAMISVQAGGDGFRFDA